MMYLSKILSIDTNLIHNLGVCILCFESADTIFKDTGQGTRVCIYRIMVYVGSTTLAA